VCVYGTKICVLCTELFSVVCIIVWNYDLCVVYGTMIYVCVVCLNGENLMVLGGINVRTLIKSQDVYLLFV